LRLIAQSEELTDYRNFGVKHLERNLIAGEVS